MEANLHIVGFTAIACALFCVTVAGLKNRDVASWFLIGLVASVVGAIAVCVVRPLDMDGQTTVRRRRR